MKVTNAIFERGEEMKKNRILRYRYMYLMLFPVCVWYIIFTYIPIGGLLMAFQDYKFKLGYLGSPFVGLEHFKTLFLDDYFLQAFRNTFEIALLRILFVFPSAIILALLMNELRSRIVRSFVQTISYLPHFFSWVSMAGILLMVLAEDNGLVNIMLSALGRQEIRFLTSNEYFRGVLVISDIYKDVGWNSIVYVAALSGISPSLYESAMLDGASRKQLALHITLPGIAPVVSIMFIMYVGGVFSQGFDQIYNLYNPMVYSSGDVIDTYIVRMLKTNFNMSVSAASSFIKSVVCMTFLLISNTIVRKMGQESIY